LIYGIGHDLCDIDRMQAALHRHPVRLVQKILMPAEQLQWQARFAQHPRRGAQFLATRFAAKEALSKALGLGLRPPMAWHACEIVSLPSGQPSWRMHGALGAWLVQQQLRAHVSLTDEHHMASAFVVVEFDASVSTSPSSFHV
jgi:holo-[acyl-carrier protein] synthase